MANVEFSFGGGKPGMPNLAGLKSRFLVFVAFFFQAEDGIRDTSVTGVQTCALPIYGAERARRHRAVGARPHRGATRRRTGGADRGRAEARGHVRARPGHLHDRDGPLCAPGAARRAVGRGQPDVDQRRAAAAPLSAVHGPAGRGDPRLGDHGPVRTPAARALSRGQQPADGQPLPRLHVEVGRGCLHPCAVSVQGRRQRPDRRLCGRDLRPAPAARHERHPDAHAHREPRARADRACPRGRPVLHPVREGAAHPGPPAMARLCGEGRRAARAVPLLGQQRADQPYLADALPSPARAVLRRAQPDAAPRDASGRRGPTRDRLGGPGGAQQRRRTRARDGVHHRRGEAGPYLHAFRPAAWRHGRSRLRPRRPGDHDSVLQGRLGRHPTHRAAARDPEDRVVSTSERRPLMMRAGVMALSLLMLGSALAEADRVDDVLNAGGRLAGQSLAGLDLAGADLRGADLSRANLEGTVLTGATLVGANLVQAMLRGADLREAYLRDARLGGADLRSAKLGSADFTRADLRQAQLEGADLTRAVLEAANLSDADLKAAFLPAARLARARLTGAILRGATLVGADPTQADLAGADFTGAALGAAHLAESAPGAARLAGATAAKANFTGANLRNVDLREAVLTDAVFVGANLGWANLTWVRARKANFSGASLAWARGYGADFTSANFGQAILTGAQLVGATARGADFRRARLQGTNFEQADLGSANFGETDLGQALLNAAKDGPAAARGARVP